MSFSVRIVMPYLFCSMLLVFWVLDTKFSEYLQARAVTDVIGPKNFNSSQCHCALRTTIYAFSEFPWICHLWLHNLVVFFQNETILNQVGVRLKVSFTGTEICIISQKLLSDAIFYSWVTCTALHVISRINNMAKQANFEELAVSRPYSLVYRRLNILVI